MFKDMGFVALSSTLHLFHGSKSGIQGIPKPISRKTCDFGTGLYLSDNEYQPKNLIVNDQFGNRRFYNVTLNIDGLKILDLSGEKKLWCLFIAYNRNLLDLTVYPKLNAIFEHFNKGYDVIIGDIADDKMVLVLDQFFNNAITDEALYHAMTFVSLGKQYVLKTQKACNAAIFDEGVVLPPSTIRSLKDETSKREQSMLPRLNSVLKQYRRKGFYFDEIIENYKE